MQDKNKLFNKKVSHGNNASINHDKTIDPLFETFPLTNFTNIDQKTKSPVISSQNVDEMRDFCQENKK